MDSFNHVEEAEGVDLAAPRSCPSDINAANSAPFTQNNCAASQRLLVVRVTNAKPWNICDVVVQVTSPCLDTAVTLEWTF